MLKHYKDKEDEKFMAIFYDEKVDYCKLTTDDSEISPMIRTTKSEFDAISANSDWIEMKDNIEQKQLEGLLKLYKVREQSFGICAIYYGDNVQWTTIIEVIPENWSTTSRTTFEDQWRHNLEEENQYCFLNVWWKYRIVCAYVHIRLLKKKKKAKRDYFLP